MKEDVKKKEFSPPLGEMRGVVTCIQPVPFLEGLLIWLLWLTASSNGRANPSCLFQLVGFM
jgi:hypothetical protein